MAAAHDAGVRRCTAAPYVFVPVDKSSISVTDHTGKKSLGMVGTYSSLTRGLNVMSAIAVLPDGTPQGIVGQSYWTRPRQTKRGKKATRRLRVEDKETQQWLDVISSAAARFAELAPSSRPWFQIDREGDAWAILQWAMQAGGCDMTVRAHYDRRLCVVEQGVEERQYLWPTLAAMPALGTYQIVVPQRAKQTARLATMEVRSRQVTLDMKDERTKRRMPAQLWAVWAREIDAPSEDERLEWMLLTTRPADSLEAACTVVAGYEQRWCIEEFHRVWKSGACDIESSQLQEGDHLQRWAIVLASVAMRILRMTYIARTKPAAPASDEFSAHEITAVITLAEPKNVRKGTVPTMSNMMLWIATLGGYVGRSSGGPPGATVLTRGFQFIRSAVALLAARDEEKT